MRLEATGAEGAPLIPERAPIVAPGDLAAQIAAELAGMGATAERRVNGHANGHDTRANGAD